MPIFYTLARYGDQKFSENEIVRKYLEKTSIGGKELNFDESDTIITNSKRIREISENNIINHSFRRSNAYKNNDLK